ncbi:MAG: acyl carrier protein [Syntrophobacteraceae bacterium]|jgi:acyl carrier protein
MVTMTRSEIDTIVLETFSLVMKKAFEPGEKVEREKEPAWDSLKHIELIFALEDKFDIRFTEDEMAGLKTMSSIAERIAANYAA